jgi:hypothetical protein
LARLPPSLKQEVRNGVDLSRFFAADLIGNAPVTAVEKREWGWGTVRKEFVKYAQLVLGTPKETGAGDQKALEVTVLGAFEIVLLCEERADLLGQIEIFVCFFVREGDGVDVVLIWGEDIVGKRFGEGVSDDDVAVVLLESLVSAVIVPVFRCGGEPEAIRCLQQRKLSPRTERC